MFMLSISAAEVTNPRHCIVGCRVVGNIYDLMMCNSCELSLFVSADDGLVHEHVRNPLGFKHWIGVASCDF
jgi:hypothetical protein